MIAQAQTRPLTTAQKTILGILTALLFASAVALAFGTNVQKPLDHDEHQFIASAALLAREGLLPYRDYAYFHMPNLLLVYATLFTVTDRLLLAARAFSTLCAALTLGTIFCLAFGLFRERHVLIRFLIAAGSVVFLLTNPLFTYTSGKAWNHDLPVLLTLLAFAFHIHGVQQGGSKRWVFASGLCIGLAAGARLSFALVVVPFLLTILLFPGRTRRQRLLVLPLSFGLGVVMGLLPALVLLALDPQAFLFGNLGYARYNTIYRQEMGFVEGDVSAIAMTFAGKLKYLARYVISAPGNLLLLLSWVFLALTMNAASLFRRRGPYHLALSLIVLLVPFLLAGSFAPTPVFFQYFYALVPFLILGCLYGVANLREQQWKVTWGLVLLVHVVLLAGAYGYKAYEEIATLFSPQEWLAVEAHEAGQEIDDIVGQGQVLTLAPLYPLEGETRIYEEFATGVFAWRVAPFVPEDERRRLGLVSETELPGLLSTRPPDAILAGFESGSEGPFIDYAEANSYQPFELSTGKTLWLLPR